MSEIIRKKLANKAKAGGKMADKAAAMSTQNKRSAGAALPEEAAGATGRE